jgi:anti-anti-sigma factor
MSERQRRRPTRSEQLSPSGDARFPAVLPGACHGPDVAATVTDSSGTQLLRVVLRAEPPDRCGALGPSVVAVAGEVDLEAAPLLQDALVDAVDRHRTVYCDLSDVSFFSAAGVTALVVAHERAAQVGSRLLIRGAHGITHQVLQITGLDRFLAGH